MCNVEQSKMLNRVRTISGTLGKTAPQQAARRRDGRSLLKTTGEHVHIIHRGSAGVATHTHTHEAWPATDRPRFASMHPSSCTWHSLQNNALRRQKLPHRRSFSLLRTVFHRINCSGWMVQLHLCCDAPYGATAFVRGRVISLSLRAVTE